ncbi:MAG: septation protein SepH, partial [Streptosporangiaceae bacterium]
MQELRLVAVSEDGSYVILAVPGRSGRFLLPIDDRLRTVAKGQFSRLAQFEIEVENPLRPKEIQDRIRAGETAEEIADAAGIPPDRVRRFEGPVLAERQYRAQEAQRATIRGHGESGPGPRLGDIMAERLSGVGAHADSTEWDSRKRPDGNWQVQLQFTIGGRTAIAEWIYDPRRRHVIPDDEQAIRLCLPPDEWAAINVADRNRATATVTPIGSRQHASYSDYGRDFERRGGLTASRGRDASPAAATESVADAMTDAAGQHAEPDEPAGSGTAPSGRAPSGRAPSGTAPSGTAPSGTAPSG